MEHMSNIFSTSFGINFAKLTRVWLALISLTAKIISLLFLSHPVCLNQFSTTYMTNVICSVNHIVQIIIFFTTVGKTSHQIGNEIYKNYYNTTKTYCSLIFPPLRGGKGNVDLYSTSSRTPLTRSEQGSHSVTCKQHHTGKYYSGGATTRIRRANAWVRLTTHLSTQEDEWLSWPCWLTYSGRFTPRRSPVNWPGKVWRHQKIRRLHQDWIPVSDVSLFWQCYSIVVFISTTKFLTESTVNNTVYHIHYVNSSFRAFYVW